MCRKNVVRWVSEVHFWSILYQVYKNGNKCVSVIIPVDLYFKLWCFSTQKPHRILVFAWAHGQPRSKLPCDSTPCFPGSRRRSSPSARCSSYVPFVSSKLAAAAISPSVRILSHPPLTEPRGDFLQFFFLFCLFTRRLHFGVVKSMRRCCAAHKSSAPCASVAMDWFFSPPFSSCRSLPRTSWENSPSSNLRLAFSPATCFTRPLWKVPASRCFFTF